MEKWKVQRRRGKSGVTAGEKRKWMKIQHAPGPKRPGEFLNRSSVFERRVCILLVAGAARRRRPGGSGGAAAPRENEEIMGGSDTSRQEKKKKKTKKLVRGRAPSTSRPGSFMTPFGIPLSLICKSCYFVNMLFCNLAIL